MSLLVKYTLKDAKDQDHQVGAMERLVADMKGEGVAGVSYTCFSTPDPTEFVGVLEFGDEGGKEAFLNSAAFETYKAVVGPTFANPPDASPIKMIASTRD